MPTATLPTYDELIHSEDFLALDPPQKKQAILGWSQAATEELAAANPTATPEALDRLQAEMGYFATLQSAVVDNQIRGEDASLLFEQYQETGYAASLEAEELGMLRNAGRAAKKELLQMGKGAIYHSLIKQDPQAALAYQMQVEMRDPTRAGASEFVGSVAGSLLPTAAAVVATYLPEPVSTGTGLAVLSAFGASAAGSGIQKVELHALREGRVADVSEKALVGAGYAVAEIAAERLPIRHLSKLKRADAEAIGRAALSDRKLFVQQFAKTLAESVGVNAAEEAVTQVAQNTADVVFSDLETPIMEGVGMAAAGGALGGGMLGVPAGAARGVDVVRTRRTVLDTLRPETTPATEAVERLRQRMIAATTDEAEKARLADPMQFMSIDVERMAYDETTPENLRPFLQETLEMQRLGERMGIEVVAVHGLGQNGIMLPDDPGRIYVDVRQAAASNAGIRGIAAHEMYHGLKRNSEVGATLAQRIEALVDTEGEAFGAYAQRLQRIRSDRGLSKAERTELVEEVAADFLGEQMYRAEFWDRVAKRDKTLLQSMYQTFLDFIQRMEQVIFGVADAEAMMTDLYAARDYAADLVAGVQSDAVSTDVVTPPAARPVTEGLEDNATPQQSLAATERQETLTRLRTAVEARRERRGIDALGQRRVESFERRAAQAQPPVEARQVATREPQRLKSLADLPDNLAPPERTFDETGQGLLFSAIQNPDEMVRSERGVSPAQVREQGRVVVETAKARLSAPDAARLERLVERAAGLTVQLDPVRGDYDGQLTGRDYHLASVRRALGAIAHGPQIDYATGERETQAQFEEREAYRQTILPFPYGQPVVTLDDAEAALDRIEAFDRGDAATFAEPSLMFSVARQDPAAAEAEGFTVRAFHGTRQTFDQFDSGRVGTGNGRFASGIGLYLSNNAEAARIYTRNPATAEYDGQVLPVRARLRNPFRAQGHILGQDASLKEARALTARLQEQGHDGVIIDHGAGVQEIVVFNPEEDARIVGSDEPSLLFSVRDVEHLFDPPEDYSTEDADAVGMAYQGDPADLREMGAILDEEAGAALQQALAVEPTDRAAFEAAIQRAGSLGTRAQFFREAAETAERRAPSPLYAVRTEGVGRIAAAPPESVKLTPEQRRQPRKVSAELLPLDHDNASVQKTARTWLQNAMLGMLDAAPFADIKPPRTSTLNPTVNARRLDAAKERIKQNLRMLYHGTPPELQEKWRQWYKIANEWAGVRAERHGLHSDVVAAMIARTSPGKDWFDNITIVDQMLRAMDDNPVLTQDVVDSALTRAVVGFMRNNRTATEAQITAFRRSQRAKLEKDTKSFLGHDASALGDKAATSLEAAKAAAVLLREHAQANYPQHAVDQNGDPILTMAGEPKGIVWQSYGNLALAFQIAHAPSAEAVGTLLGRQHKTRSFYNNIIDPDDTEFLDVTEDTHAVSAGLLLPLAQGSYEVAQNFGGSMKQETNVYGKPTTTVGYNNYSGLSGTYFVYAEAYRDVAAEVGILPRELQSITWEAVKDLFPPAFRRDKGALDRIRTAWVDFGRGRLTHADLVRTIMEERQQWQQGKSTPTAISLRSEDSQSPSPTRSSSTPSTGTRATRPQTSTTGSTTRSRTPSTLNSLSARVEQAGGLRRTHIGVRFRNGAVAINEVPAGDDTARHRTAFFDNAYLPDGSERFTVYDGGIVATLAPPDQDTQFAIEDAVVRQRIHRDPILTTEQALRRVGTPLYSLTDPNRDLDELGEFLSKHLREQASGIQTGLAGTPQRAIPVDDPSVRQLVPIIDSVREARGLPERQAIVEIRQRAQDRVDAAPQEEWAKLLNTGNDRARGGTTLDFQSAEDVMVARILMDRFGADAIARGDTAAIARVGLAIDIYRSERAELARALMIGRDFTETPAQRHRRFITLALTQPSPTVMQRIQDLGYEQRIKELEREAARRIRIIEQLKLLGYDVNNLTDEQLSDPKVVSQILRQLQTSTATAGDKVFEYWRNSILSSPATQLANILGNSSNLVWEYTAQRGAEALANLMTGNRLDATTFAELKEAWKGFLPGVVKGWRNGMLSWDTESPTMDQSGKLELRGVAIRGTKGRVIRSPQRALLAADEVAKSLVVQMEVRAQAYRNWVAAGRQGSLVAYMNQAEQDHSSAEWTAALEQAKYLTFQTEPGALAAALIQWRDSKSSFVKWGARFLFPFIVTPANIVKQGVAATPLGLAKLVADAKAGKPTATQVRNSARFLLSLGATFAVAAMMEPDEDDEDGRPWITGSPAGFRDRGQREFQYRYAPPQSIRIGDRWFSYARIEPFATTLTGIVDILGTARSAQSLEEALGGVAAAASQPFTEKTFLRGIGDLWRVIEDTKDGNTDQAQSWVANFGASWWPNLFRAGTRAAVPYVGERRALSTPDRLVEGLAPGSLAPPKVDLWGREVRSEGAFGGPLTDYVYKLTMPVRTQSEQPVELDRLIFNYNRAEVEGRKDWYPQQPSHKWESARDGEVELTAEEYHEFLVLRGEAALRLLSGATLNFDEPTDRDKDRIDNALSNATSIAKTQIMRRRREAAVTPLSPP